MQLLDTPTRYGTISRFFHWSIGALIIWQILSMAAKNTLGRESALAGFMVGSHASVGFIIFLLVWLRVGWALINRGRRPVHGDGLLGLAARAGHFVLYLLMLFIPTVAVLRAFGGERPFTVFGIQLSAGQPEGQEIEAMTGLANFHGEMGWLLAVLILGHIGMAIFHLAVLRDRTIAKMA